MAASMVSCRSYQTSTPGEAFDQAFSVLPDTPHEIGSDTDIERAIAPAGEQVDGGGFSRRASLLREGGLTEDQACDCR